MSKPIIERKFSPISSIKLETRKDDSSGLPQISGYSALFNSETIIESWFGDSWRETIRAGFFAPAIKNNHDVRALFNHDANHVLGRTTSPKKTLTIKEDKVGLYSVITPPNTALGKDTVELIERGDISGQSFAFTLAEERWVKGSKGQLDIRELTLIDTLYDVGPVTYPAFEDTDISVNREAALQQAAVRSRGLSQFGEEIPKYVMKELQNRTQIAVPASFSIDPDIRSLIKEVVKETLSEQLSEQSDEPVDPPKKSDKIDIFETDPDAIHEEAPAEEILKEEAPSEVESAPEAEPEATTEGDLRAEFLKLEKVALGR